MHVISHVRCFHLEEYIFVAVVYSIVVSEVRSIDVKFYVNININVALTCIGKKWWHCSYFCGYRWQKLQSFQTLNFEVLSHNKRNYFSKSL